MKYTFTNKRYCITYKNGQGDIKTLTYRIVDTPVSTLWMDRVRSAKSNPACAVFPNQWASYIPTLDKVNRQWRKMKSLVDETNSGKFVKVDYIYMPEEFDPLIDQQPLLNSLHFKFHKFEEETIGQTNGYNPLVQLNVEIHTLETLAGMYRYGQTSDDVLITGGFFLHPGYRDVTPIPKDLYIPYWNHTAEFGDMVLGYHTVGKNIMHCWKDNDIDLVKNNFVRPQTELGNETILMFPGRFIANASIRHLELIRQWVKDNQLESYIDMSLPENSVASLPLLGRLEDIYSRDEISYLFENYKVVDAELLE